MRKYLFEKKKTKSINKFSKSRNASVVLVLDLSRPEELWQTYQTIYEAVAKRVKHCISEASKQNPNIKDKLKDSILKRIGNAVCLIGEISERRIPIFLFRIKMKLNLFVFHC